MEKPRWWHVAITAMAVVLTVLVLTAYIPLWEQIGALGSLAAFVVGWFTIGWRSFHRQPGAWVFSAIAVVTIGTAVAFHPMMAIMQCVGYPLLWVISCRTRDAIISNVALASAVGIGFWVGTDDLPQTVITAGLSLAFSLALGLWITQIADRSEERQRLLEELRATQDRLAVVNRDAGVASERERLAREIHDTIAQDLTGLVMLTQQARRELAAGRTGSADEQLVLIEDNARTTLAETRALVAASAPVGLTTGGLADALDRLAARFTRETGIEVTVAGDPGVLDRDSEVVLLRCAQEALANVRKHADATAVSIEVGNDGQGSTLCVTDNGHGFDAQSHSDGFGLAGMRDRLALVGGALTVTSSADGTQLTANLVDA